MELNIQSPKPIDVETINNEVKIETITKAERGYSAYEIAVQNGFKGTEEEWLLSLKGENYNITQEDYNEIASIVEDNIKPTLEENLQEAKDYADSTKITKTSELINDSDFTTNAYVEEMIGIINSELSTLTTVGGV